MKQHRFFHALLQGLFTGFAAISLLFGCSDSKTDTPAPKPDPEPETPTAVTFTITLGSYDQQGVSLKVTPSDEQASYYCNLFEASTFEGLSPTTPCAPSSRGSRPKRRSCTPAPESSPLRVSSPPTPSTAFWWPATMPRPASRATSR